MNLFIGVILDGFDEAGKEETDIITQEDFSRFARNWEEFDPRATCLMSIHDLPKFLETLFAPWGFGGEDHTTDRELRNKIERLNIRVTSDNQVHFQDVLMALSREVHRAEAEKKGATVDLSKSVRRKRNRSIGRRRNSIEKAYIFNPFSNREVTLEQILAAEYIQRAYRRKKVWERRKRERMAEWAPFQGQLRVMDSPKDDKRGERIVDFASLVGALLAANEGSKRPSSPRAQSTPQDGGLTSSSPSGVVQRAGSDVAGINVGGASLFPLPEVNSAGEQPGEARPSRAPGFEGER